MKTRAVPSLSLAVVLGLTACGSDYPLGAEQEAAAQRGDMSLQGAVTASGSSAQGPAMDAWRSGFATLYPRAQVQYSPDGSGAGRGALLAGAVGFAGSDAYLDDEERAESTEVCGPGGAFNIPAYVSPISIAFNLPGIKALDLDAATVARMFRGEIAMWNDPAIAAQNPDVELPALPVSAVSRSDDSGTTENFTDYLHAVAPEAWPEEPDGMWPEDLENENAKGNAGVVTTVVGTVGAVTYADDSAVGDPLGRVALRVGDTYVPVSSEAAAAAVDLATRVPGRQEYDLALDLDRTTTAPGVYPLVLVSYHVYCARYENEATAVVVRAFGTYAVSAEGQAEAAAAAKSSPISAALSRQAADAIASIEVGRIP